MLWIAAFVTAFCLYLLVGDRVLYFALAPHVALLYATMNWDLLAVALATVGTLAYLRRRDGWSGVLFGPGAAAKIFPMFLVVLFVAARFRGGARRWIRSRGRDGDVGRGNLPFVLLAPTGWWEFFRYNAARLADWDSLWYLVCERTTGETCTNTRLVNLASVGSFVAWVAVGSSRRGVRTRVPSMDTRFPDPGAVPADQQGLLAAIQPVAAPMVRARVPSAGVVRALFELADLAGVRHALLVARLPPASTGGSPGCRSARSSSRSRSAR